MHDFGPDRAMYRWRRMTPEQRDAVLRRRKKNRRPWHRPPHYASDETSLYLITAACYEHASIIGHSSQRMTDFEETLLNEIDRHCRRVFAWNILPNHYHALVDTPDVKALLKGLGQMHGRTSFQWNGEEHRRGRQVWQSAAETAMKSEGHFWATLNYVLHNAVHHGYVRRWQDWPWSNAEEYLAAVGADAAESVWKAYPILDYGKGWDAPEM